MATKRIIYTRPDGGVSIVVPTPEFIASFLTETEVMVAVQKTSVPVDAIDVETVEVLDIPTDRAFRDAWIKKVGGVEVDMAKARSIHMNQIRKARDVELEKSDVPFMRALEAGDAEAQSRIAGEKQTLRDIPQTFDLTARTPEQLKGKWPTELPARTA